MAPIICKFFTSGFKLFIANVVSIGKKYEAWKYWGYEEGVVLSVTYMVEKEVTYLDNVANTFT